MFCEGDLGFPAKHSNPFIGPSVPFFEKDTLVLDIFLWYFIYFFLFQEITTTSVEDIFHLWPWKLICYQSMEARGVYTGTIHPDAVTLPSSAARVNYFGGR